MHPLPQRKLRGGGGYIEITLHVPSLCILSGSSSMLLIYFPPDFMEMQLYHVNKCFSIYQYYLTFALRLLS